MSHLVFELPAPPPAAPSDARPRPVGDGSDSGRDADRLSLCHIKARSFAPGAELARLSLTRSDAVPADPRRELARLSLSLDDRPPTAGKGWLDGRWM